MLGSNNWSAGFFSWAVMKQLNHITIIGSNSQTMAECQRSLKTLPAVKDVRVALCPIDNSTAEPAEVFGRSDLVIFDLSQNELQLFRQRLRARPFSESASPAVIVHTSASWLDCRMVGIDQRVSVVPRGATLFDWKLALSKQGVQTQSAETN